MGVQAGRAQLPVCIPEVASEGLGIERLRRGQREAADAVVAGRDTLLVMPTGSGKSAVYQIAGALLPGWTLVVSPLIALQQDQVASLDDADVGRAVAVNSALGAGRRRRLLDELAAGDIEFVFVAPEQLANDETRAELAAHPPSLFVVDEAHCVSRWWPTSRDSRRRHRLCGHPQGDRGPG